MASQKKQFGQDCSENDTENSGASEGALNNGANGFPVFADLLRQTLREDSDTKNSRSLLQELALAAVENLGEGDALENDSELRSLLIRRELESWAKEIRRLGSPFESYYNYNAFFTAEKHEIARPFFGKYPHLPAGEIVYLDMVTNGFFRGFSQSDGGFCYRDPDIFSAVEGVIKNKNTPLLRQELGKARLPAYFKKAFQYVDEYCEYWKKELANRVLSIGTKKEIDAKLVKTEEIRRIDDEVNGRKGLLLFLKPFYFHTEWDSWPWGIHERTFGGDLARIKPSSGLRFTNVRGYSLRSIWPLKKENGRYFFLFFGSHNPGEDDWRELDYNRTYFMDEDGKLLNVRWNESKAGFYDGPSRAGSSFYWSGKIEEECPDLFKLLEPFPDGKCLHMPTYEEALENGLSSVRMFFDSSSPTGEFHSTGWDSRDDYLRIFNALHEPPSGKNKKAPKCLACSRTVKFSFRGVHAFLVQVREENVKAFFDSYYGKLLKGSDGE